MYKGWELFYTDTMDNSQANRHKKEKMLKGISLPAGIPAGKILLFLVRS